MKKLHVSELLEVIKRPDKLFTLSRKYSKKMFEKKLIIAVQKGYINPETMKITLKGQQLLINMRKEPYALNRMDQGRS